MCPARDGLFSLLVVGFLAFCFILVAPKLMSVPMPQVVVQSQTVVSIPVTGMDNADRYFISHAVEKHGEEAVVVRNCINNKGMHSLWHQDNNNYVQLCQVDDNTWGMRICKTKECGLEDEITAFLKNKMSRFEQIAKYLSNHGATQVQ